MPLREFFNLRKKLSDFQNRFTPGVLILLYHRIASLPSDPCRLCVSPKHFAEHLEVLKKICRVMSLRDLTRALDEGELPHRAVVITFDDGFADNLQMAKPLLARHDMPATVFVTSGQIGAEREFWWDELDRLLLQPVELPPSITLGVNGQHHTFDTSNARHFTAEDARRGRAWHAYQPNDPHPRYTLFRSILQRLARETPAVQRAVTEQLRKQLGASLQMRRTHRCMSAGEIRVLEHDGLVEIGAHTVSHPWLAAIPLAEQRREMAQSKAELEEILGKPVTSFAYPHGSRA